TRPSTPACPSSRPPERNHESHWNFRCGSLLPARSSRLRPPRPRHDRRRFTRALCDGAGSRGGACRGGGRRRRGGGWLWEGVAGVGGGIEIESEAAKQRMPLEARGGGVTKTFLDPPRARRSVRGAARRESRCRHYASEQAVLHQAGDAVEGGCRRVFLAS